MGYKRIVTAALAMMLLPQGANALISGQPVGSMFTGVGRFSYWSGPGTAQSGEQCTGSLIAANVVLTATHCLEDSPDYKFVLGDGANETAFTAIGSKNWSDDLSAITLDRDAPDTFARYGLYDKQDEIGKMFTMVGAGMSGTLATGGVNFGGDLRYGYNTFDVTRADYDYAFARQSDPNTPKPIGLSDYLLYDYDDGNPTHDVFGRYLGIHGLGVKIGGKLVESGHSYGDSGGPNFIDGLIAGVISFGISGNGWENGACGQPGNVVPHCGGEDSTGDIGGSERVSLHAADIRSYIASVAGVPESSTWIMMILGFGLVGQQCRRYRRASRQDGRMSSDLAQA